MQHSVGIMAVGLVSPAGNAPEDVLAAARNGGSAPTELTFEDSPPLRNVLGYRCSFPEAKVCLGPGRLRRLGRLLTMSLLAARKAASELSCGGSSSSDASVFIGTGLGSLGDTSAFVENMIRQEERFPKPASFVNSVHNAAASQIAMELGLQGQNLTFTHRETSFEAALWHAARSLQEGRSRYAVVGGVDELNYYHLIAGEKKGLWKNDSEPLAPLSTGPSCSNGSLPGEGAVMCVLARAGERDTDAEAYGRVRSVKSGRFHRHRRTYLDVDRTVDFLVGALTSAGKDASSVDLLLSGANGDSRLDKVYRSIGDELSRRAGRAVAHGTFKQLCGDYHSAGAFGFAIAALVLRSGRAPAGLFCDPANEPAADCPMRTVLLYGLSRSGTHGVCVVQR